MPVDAGECGSRTTGHADATTLFGRGHRVEAGIRVVTTRRWGRRIIVELAFPISRQMSADRSSCDLAP